MLFSVVEVVELLEFDTFVCDKGSQHDTNVTPSPLVSSDNNSQLENTRMKNQSHIISSNRSIQPSEMHTKVSNSSSSTTSTTENNIYDKTTGKLFRFTHT
jgi:GTP-dependent phosphoenolpyruvate carboxykinase